MKKITICLLLLCALSFLSAKDRVFEAPIKSYSPSLMGQGGSATANVQGFDALFTNPAAFVDDKGELTVLTLQPSWEMDVFNFLDDYRDGDLLNAFMNQITNNGLGAHSLFSFGYVGKHVGFGVFAALDTFFPQAETPLGANGDVTVTVGVTGGYAHQFDFGDITLNVGADIRPMYRTSAKDINVETFINMVENESEDTHIDVLSGFGIGIDAGLLANWKFLTLGCSLRDIGHTRFFYSARQIDLDGKNVAGSKKDIDESYMSPMTLRFGLAVSPEDKLPIHPILHGEVAFPLIGADSIEGYESSTIWTRVNMGLDVEILSILSARAGFNGGYFTAGMGLRLAFFELNAALYSQEKGLYAGHERVMGGSVDLSIRF